MTSFSDTPEFKQLLTLLGERNFPAAKELCDRIGQSPLGLFLSSEALLRTNNLKPALDWAKRSVEGAPEDASARSQLAKCYFYNNDQRQALQTAEEAVALEPESVHDLDTLANVYSHCGDQDRALALFEKAAQLAPDNPDVVYNLATSYRFLGRNEQAEDAFNRVIGLNPLDYSAVMGRSLLRTQTADNNHLEQLEEHLKSTSIAPTMNNECRVHYCYSLAKEYEDLGRFEDSFKMLKAGADLKHQSMNYLADQDLATMGHLKQHFTRDALANLKSSASSDQPIFVLGLPRSGTTLVERILASHRDVASAGEIMTFPNIVVPMVAPPGREAPHPLSINFDQLGHSYIQRTSDYLSGPNEGKHRLIDKLPLNYLNIGYIRAALPNAKIVLLDRDPMDSCYAMYKSLFNGTVYPFSYDLTQLGRYYQGYADLMAHFQQELAVPPYVVKYEELTADPEPQIRALLEYCDLPWDDNCLAFHTNELASTTQSASQIREPVHTRSVGLWQQYEQQLQPLAQILEKD